MDLSYFHNFMVIAEERNFSKASYKLNIAQPALNYQIKQLEELFNARLVLTGKGMRHLELTNAGMILYEAAKKICMIEENAKEDISALCSGTEGILKLSYTASLADDIIGKIISGFSQEYPKVRYYLEVISSNKIIDKLVAGESEIGIVRMTHTNHEKIDSVVLNTQRVFASVAIDNPYLLSKELNGLTWDHLKGVPLITSNAWVNHIKVKCSAAGFDANIHSICTDRYSCLAMARMGNSVAITSQHENEFTRVDKNWGLIHIPIDDFDTTSYTFMCKVRDHNLSAVGRNFWEFVLNNHNITDIMGN